MESSIITPISVEASASSIGLIADNSQQCRCPYLTPSLFHWLCILRVCRLFLAGARFLLHGSDSAQKAPRLPYPLASSYLLMTA